MADSTPKTTFTSTSTIATPDTSLGGGLLGQTPFLKTPLERIQESFEERNDKTPVLLLPVRVETRFMTIKHVYRMIPGVNQGRPSIPDKKELWVRFYPDDIAIDTHETALTEDEISAAKTYWTEVHAANQDKDLLLGAWRVIAQAFGSPRAAYVVNTMTPTNYNASTGTFLGVPVFPSPDIKAEAWSQAPKSFVLPDKFVVITYRGSHRKEYVGRTIPSDLQLGIDPAAEEEFVQENGSLTVPKDMRWMTDFEEALRVGMAVRIPLLGTEQLGFDRLLVVGLKLSKDENESHALLEDLFNHHHYSTGMALVPQGTPTNNTEDADSGYNDAELSVDTSFETERGKPLVKYVSDYRKRSDGQWFADALGLEYSVVEHLHHADGTDVQEALAMNRSLWPGTMQFAMRQMMHPMFEDRMIRDTESFFKKWVTGRGHIPAFRVGDQPYGVLPTTAFSQWEYRSTDYFHRYHKKLWSLLGAMNQQWDKLSEKVKTVGADNLADLNEDFLGVMGLHASSVEFFQRFAVGPDVIHGLENFYKALTGRTYYSRVNEVDPLKDAEAIGNLATVTPYASSVISADSNRHLTGPVVDDVPLSEDMPVQPLAGSQKNYIGWLIEATHSALKNEDFSVVGADNDAEAPRALLYLYLRYAILLEYASTAFDILEDNGVVQPGDRFVTDFAHVAPRTLSYQEKVNLRLKVEDQVLQQKGYQMDSFASSKLFMAASPTKTYSRSTEINKYATQINQEYTRQVRVIEEGPIPWADGNQVFAQVDPSKPITAYIDGLSKTSSKTRELRELRDALKLLENVPTARLERLLAEHLDLCSYRLDAWKRGIVEERLYGHRGAGSQRKKGIHLGAFGWLENVWPGSLPGVHVKEAVRRSGKSLLSSSASDFNIESQAPFSKTENWVYLGTSSTLSLKRDAASGLLEAPLREDPENQGFIHTPSINHAATAAILRAGYKADPDSSMAVNLNSARVRTALFYVQGVRHGQTLGALLGYRLERRMHGRELKGLDNKLIALDAYIAEMRTLFPLVAGSATPATPATSIETLEARNVVDGLKAVERYRNLGSTAFAASLGIASGIVRTAMVEEVKAISDELDAVADLALSESVFQLAHGRKERANAVLRALNGEGSFPEMEIVKTPRTGKALKHRVLLHLDAPNATGKYWTPPAIRGLTEPKLNTFLGEQLGDPEKICFAVSLEYTATNGSTRKLDRKVKLSQLSMQPYDFLLTVGRQMDNPEGSDLAQRIAYILRSGIVRRDDGTVRVSFTSRKGLAADEKTLAEVMAHVEGLLDVVRNSRAMEPEDLLLPGEIAPETGGVDVAELGSRIKRAINGRGLPYSLMYLRNHIRSYLRRVRDEGRVSYARYLRDRMFQAADFNIDHAVPTSCYSRNAEEIAILVEQAEQVLVKVEALYEASYEKYNAAASLNDAGKLRVYKALAVEMLGKDFKIVPCFLQRDSTTFAEAHSYAETGNLLAEGGDFPMEEWLHGISRVRPRMADLMRLSVLGEALHGEDRLPALLPVQFPHTKDENEKPDARWTGIEFPESYEVPDDVLSLINMFPKSYDAAVKQGGLVLDEWSEIIPSKTENTGLAVHVNQPNATAPQSLLLCVTPVETGKWDWEALLETVNETLDSAKQRAVDPAIIDTSVYAQFLPMLYGLLTSQDGFPTLDFAKNIGPTFRGIFASDFVLQNPALFNTIKLFED